jgi:coenzyme F420-0:L-glutamate ligase / coenzyme F420-1:gamma-L-glutamate ligase
MIEIVPLRGVPDIGEGDARAGLPPAACADAGVALADGDVVCVAQKAVSKAEGAVVRPPPPGGPPGARRAPAPPPRPWPIRSRPRRGASSSTAAC